MCNLHRQNEHRGNDQPEERKNTTNTWGREFRMHAHETQVHAMSNRWKQSGNQGPDRKYQ